MLDLVGRDGSAVRPGDGDDALRCIVDSNVVRRPYGSPQGINNIGDRRPRCSIDEVIDATESHRPLVPGEGVGIELRIKIQRQRPRGACIAADGLRRFGRHTVDARRCNHGPFGIPGHRQHVPFPVCRRRHFRAVIAMAVDGRSQRRGDLLQGERIGAGAGHILEVDAVKDYIPGFVEQHVCRRVIQVSHQNGLHPGRVQGRRRARLNRVGVGNGACVCRAQEGHRAVAADDCLVSA